MKKLETQDQKFTGEIQVTVDARGFSCPLPVLHSKKAIKKMKTGDVMEILTTDPGSQRDIPAWTLATGQELLSSEEIDSKEFRFLVRKQE